jgi:hypothetical protein
MTYFFLQFWKWPNLSYTFIEIKTQYMSTKKHPKQQLMLRELTKSKIITLALYYPYGASGVNSGLFHYLIVPLP